MVVARGIVLVALLASACRSGTSPVLAVDGAGIRGRTLDVAGKTTCAVRGGKVYCFGLQVGVHDTDPNASPSAHPVAIHGETDVARVSVAVDHACLLRAGGSVACWGVVDDGTKGATNSRGGYTPRTLETPEAVAGLTAIQLASGDSFTCALRPAGDVVCWGMNSLGGLGDDTKEGRLTPAPVLGLAGVVEIAAGGGRACARRAEGEVVCWGSSEGHDERHPRAIPELTGATSLAVSRRRMCALHRSGDSGVGDVVCVSARGKALEKDAIRKLDAVALHLDASDQLCVVQSTGKVHCDRPPFDAIANELSDAASVVSSDGRVCVESKAGAIVCWGANDHGQAGRDFRLTLASPTRVDGVGDATHVAVGSMTACATRKDGSVVCWGSDLSGALGDGHPDTTGVAEARRFVFPQPVPGVTHATAIVAGASQFCALGDDGGVTCWGGDGRRSCYTKPCYPVARIEGINDAVELASYRTATCAVQRAGTVVCWGRPFDMVGAGRPHAPWSEPGPATISGLTGVAHFAVGYREGCAIRQDGTVVCMGDAVASGFTQKENANAQGIFAEVAGATSVAGMSIGQPNHLLLRGGELRALDWGPIYVTDPTRSDRLEIREAPVKTVLSDVAKVVQDQYDGCALQNTGAVQCWHATEAPRRPGVADAVDVAHASVGGMGATCAVRRSGDVACWGANASGQCGVDPNAWVSQPTVVQLPP